MKFMSQSKRFYQPLWSFVMRNMFIYHASAWTIWVLCRARCLKEQKLCFVAKSASWLSPVYLYIFLFFFFLFSCFLNGKPTFCSHPIDALSFSRHLLVKEPQCFELRPRGKESKHHLFHDFTPRRRFWVIVGVCWTWGAAAGLCWSQCSMSSAWIFALWLRHCIYVSVDYDISSFWRWWRRVIFQDLWISMGSDKWSFIDRIYIYNAKGQSQILPAETKNMVHSHCLCPCSCQCLTNKKWKQKCWREPEGNRLQMNSDKK